MLSLSTCFFWISRFLSVFTVVHPVAPGHDPEDAIACKGPRRYNGFVDAQCRGKDNIFSQEVMNMK